MVDKKAKVSQVHSIKKSRVFPGCSKKKMFCFKTQWAERIRYALFLPSSMCSYCCKPKSRSFLYFLDGDLLFCCNPLWTKVAEICFCSALSTEKMNRSTRFIQNRGEKTCTFHLHTSWNSHNTGAKLAPSQKHSSWQCNLAKVGTNKIQRSQQTVPRDICTSALYAITKFWMPSHIWCLYWAGWVAHGKC